MKTDITQQIAKDLVKKIDEFEPSASARRVGHIISLSDGVAKVSGLPHVAYMEKLEFPHNIYGFAINLEEDAIGAIILGDYLRLKQGDEVQGTGQLLSVPVDEAFLGRVINPIGEPVDGKGTVKTNKFYPLEKIAPGVVARQQVNTPIQTGIKAIDAMTGSAGTYYRRP
jgi:F-type H+-transporting ATPase subunit alpha